MRDEIDVDDNASDGKSIKYKTKIGWKTPEGPRPENPGNANQPPQPAALHVQPRTLNVEVTIPLKYLSNFWRFLDLPLMNCEMQLDLSWTKDCVLIEHHNNIEGVHFKIASTKLYVKVVTSSINDNIKFSENIKQEFKDNSWKKHRSEITTEQKKPNNLDYLIDPTVRNIDRLFVLSFKNGDDDCTINSFDEYYMLFVQIKDFQGINR